MNGQPDGGFSGNGNFSRNNETVFQRFFTSREYAPARELMTLGSILGLAFVCFFAFGRVYGIVIRSFPLVYEKYVSDVTFSYLCDGIYSFACVGLPFLLAYILLKRWGMYPQAIPAGKPYSPSRAVLIILGATGLCFVGNYVTSYFTLFLERAGIEFYSYKLLVQGEVLPDDIWGTAVFIMRTALIPAVIEEFALRGVVLQSLRKYGDWFAVIASAVIFGLMHGNMTQVPFALIAGLGLGYCFVTTGTIWCPVIIHFANNFTAAISTIIRARLGDGASSVFVGAADVLYIGLGAVAVFVYCVKNPYFYRLYPSEEQSPKRKFTVFFASPAVLFSVMLSVKKMLDDIIR